MGDVVAFGPYVLDPRDRTLWRGKAQVPLRPRAYDVLRMLVAHAGEVVEKPRFFHEVWAGLAVSDEVLKVAVHEIRTALDDGARDPLFVETIGRVGYRFIAPVARQPRPPQTTTRIAYARNGDANLAYQTWGTGPIDILYLPGWISHLELQWAHPLSARFLERLGRAGRVITYDRRGTGLSDRDATGTLDERLVDIRHVLDAAGSARAFVFGVSEAGCTAAMFAARFPERVAGLVLYGSTARALNGDQYDGGNDPAVLEYALGTILSQWGEPLFLELEAPSVADDPGVRDWWARFLRSSASPATAAAALRANLEIDITDTLPSIRTPTLIVHRTGDRMMPLAGARYLADRIDGARLVEIPGVDHLPFVGDIDTLLQEVEGFVGAGSR